MLATKCPTKCVCIIVCRNCLFFFFSTRLTMDNSFGGAKPKTPLGGKSQNRSTVSRSVNDHVERNHVVADKNLESVRKKANSYSSCIKSNRKDACASKDDVTAVGNISKELLSAKERWRKSGQALRRYIAEKLGFKHEKHAAHVKHKPDDLELKQPASRDSKKKKQEKSNSVQAGVTSEKKLVHSKSFLEKLGIKKDHSPTHKCSVTKPVKSQSLDSSSSTFLDSTSSDILSSLSSHSNLTSQSECDIGTHRGNCLRADRLDSQRHNALKSEQKVCKKKEKLKEKSKEKCKKTKRKSRHLLGEDKVLPHELGCLRHGSSDDEQSEFTFGKLFKLDNT